MIAMGYPRPGGTASCCQITLANAGVSFPELRRPRPPRAFAALCGDSGRDKAVEDCPPNADRVPPAGQPLELHRQVGVVAAPQVDLVYVLLVPDRVRRGSSRVAAQIIAPHQMRLAVSADVHVLD